MSCLKRGLAIASVASLVFALATGCDADGVTPKCDPSGNDCFTYPPANPDDIGAGGSGGSGTGDDSGSSGAAGADVTSDGDADDDVTFDGDAAGDDVGTP